MKIIKFSDDYMRNDGKSDRFHFYAVYKNKKTGKYNAIALTHISRPDYSREEKIRRGEIKPIRLKSINKYSDSGITKYVYSTANHGQDIDIKKGLVISEKVSSTSAAKIRRFASNNSQFVSYRQNRRRQKHKKIRR